MSRNARRRRNNRRQRQLAPRGNRNSTVTRQRRAPAAQTQIITNNGTLRTLRVRHKEMVDDIDIPATSGVLETFEVNPGLPSCFPWLSQIAQRFETYNFNSLAFHWVTAVPTSTAGMVALVPDYDPADDNSLASKRELLSFEDSVRGSWWANFTMKSKPHNLRKRKEYYVRGQALAANLDIKTYDVAQLHVHKSGTSAEVGGELWVEYDISFHTPQMKHEGEALSQKGGEFSFTCTPAYLITSLYEKLRKIDAFIDESGISAIKMATPGAYLVNTYCDDGGGGALPKHGYDDTYRDSYYVDNVIAYDTGPPETDYATTGIWDVYETADEPDSRAFLTMPATFAASVLTNTWVTHISELLPDSPFRLAYEVRNTHLKKLRIAGKPFRGVCLCPRCMKLKKDHPQWDILSKYPCKMVKAPVSTEPPAEPKPKPQLQTVEVDGIEYQIVRKS